MMLTGDTEEGRTLGRRFSQTAPGTKLAEARHRSPAHRLLQRRCFRHRPNRSARGRGLGGTAGGGARASCQRGSHPDLRAARGPGRLAGRQHGDQRRGAVVCPPDDGKRCQNGPLVSAALVLGSKASIKHAVTSPIRMATATGTPRVLPRAI